MFQKRLLKFRAWIKADGFFFKDGDKMIQPETLEGMMNHNFTEFPGTWTWDFVTIMQYTGMKDRNGVEIYEGDILQFVGTMKTEPFLMGWDAERCTYTNFSPRDRVEVIGNIFQNPELLPAQ